MSAIYLDSRHKAKYLDNFIAIRAIGFNSMRPIRPENTVMTTAKQNLPLLSLGNFTASKKARFFQTLKQLRFKGQLILTDPAGQQWVFHIYLGCITYATGGTHPVRRWLRNLATSCPHIPAQFSALQRELSSIEPTTLTTYWDYQLLCLWVAQHKITRLQAANMVRGVVNDALFDVAQAKDVSYQIRAEYLFPKQIVLIDAEEVITKVQQLWQDWQNGKLVAYSPNKAPVIKQARRLREHTSAQTYQSLVNLLNGQQSLRDLAVQMRRDIVLVTRSLLPYVQFGVVELTDIPDLPIPVNAQIPTKQLTQTAAISPLVACVDDNLWVCQTMEKLLTAAGYRFVGVNDALRAIATLIARKPDLIFLDLVMPNTNGYEICTQLRKLSLFRNTPIIILTGNDGVVDQVRARLVGASDFLSKPIDAGKVLSVIHKHLEQAALT